jgi:hypothetical protein
MTTLQKIVALRNRFYAGRLSVHSYYRRCAALLMLEERARIKLLH